MPPGPGQLWTPGYWGFERGRYNWHGGYWGGQVGFYGGVNYGNGYFGTGFNGGRWDGDRFHHNTAIVNVDRTNVHNVYEDRTVVRDVRGPNHAYNGGRGIQTRPSPQEMEAGRAPHVGPTQIQQSHAQEAHDNHMAAHGSPRGGGGERH